MINLERRVSRREFLGFIATVAKSVVATALPLDTALAQQLYRPKDSDTYDVKGLVPYNERQEFIDGIISPLPDEVASVTYVTPEILLKLIERYKDGEEGKNGFNGYGSITIPIDFDKVTLGTKSAIYIFDEFFYDLVRFFPTLQNKKSEDTLITIVKNVIEKHEFVHARHFNRGIDEYPFEFFKYENGEINGGLFRIVSEILSLESEYNSLVEDERARFNPILMNYALKLKSKARRLYSLIFDNEGLTKDMGSEFITRLKNDLKPDKLFKATFFK